MTLAARFQTARALPGVIVLQTRTRTLCALPATAYGATVTGLRVTVTALTTGEMAHYDLERGEDGYLGLPGFSGYWADAAAAAYDLVMLAAHDGQPADLTYELEVAA